MNSLSDLNTHCANIDVFFQDLRDTGWEAIPSEPSNQTLEVYESATYNSPLGINIIEVTGEDNSELGFTMTFTFSTSHIDYLDWANLPGGVSVDDTTPGTVIVSAINTLEEWNQVKTPIVYPVIGFNGEYSYTVELTSQRNGTVSWTNTITVVPVPMVGNATNFNYTDTITQYITGAPRILEDVYDPNIEYEYKVTPSNTSFVDEINSYYTGGGTRDFNTTTKVLTLTGTKTEINTMLTYLYLNATASADADMTMTYNVTNQTSLETAEITQTATYSNLEYWDLPPAETYTTNQAELLAAPDLVYDDTFVNVQVFPETVAMTQLIGVDGSSATKTQGFSADTDSIVRMSLNRQYIVIANTNSTQVDIYYSATGVNHTLQQTLSVAANVQGLSVTSTRILMQTADNTIRVYKKNTTWDSELNISSGAENFRVDQDSLAPTSDYFALRGINNHRIYYFNGSSWVQQASISAPDVYSDDVVCKASRVLFKHGSWSTGIFSYNIYVYVRSGTTWSLEQTISKTINGDSRISMNANTDKIVISGNTAGDLMQVYTRDTSTWSLASTLGQDYGRISYLGNYIIAHNAVTANSRSYYKNFSGIWYNFEMKSITEPGSEAGVYFVSSDNDDTDIVHFYLWDDGATISIMYFNTDVTNINANTTFNSSAQVLTITGTKAQVNTVLDNLIMLPGANRVDDIVLTYQLNLTGTNVTTTQYIPLA